MSEESGRCARRRGDERLRGTPDGGGRNWPVGKRYVVRNGLSRAIAREQRAERKMQVAQLRLRRTIVALGRVVFVVQCGELRRRGAREVPDRMCECAVLRDQQEHRTSEMEEGPLAHKS